MFWCKTFCSVRKTQYGLLHAKYLSCSTYRLLKLRRPEKKNDVYGLHTLNVIKHLNVFQNTVSLGITSVFLTFLFIQEETNVHSKLLAVVYKLYQI